MPPLKIAASARADLYEIGRFTLKTWGLDQSFAYLDKLAEAFRRVAEHPFIGRPADHIRPGFFQYTEGRHLVFYRIAKDGRIEIIRVLHQAMDLDHEL